MLVRELFIRNPAFCRPDTNVAAAASLMWERDCGMLPVVDHAQHLVGLITDRDICMALSTRDLRPSTLPVRDVMTTPAHGITMGDSLAHALKVMRQHRVRRLPVVDSEGKLEGVLSLNDLILAAGETREPGYEDVMLTQKAICGHAKPALV